MLTSITYSYWEFDLTVRTATYTNMHAAFNDNGVETCEGNYAPPYNDRYFWFNCISGYSLQINEDLNDQHRWSITYSTPHGGFDWIAYSSVVSGTELATGKNFC